MNIEDQLYLLYVSGMQEESLDDLVVDYLKERPEGPRTIEEAEDSIDLTDREIYYAYADDLARQPEKAQKGLDKAVAQELFRNGYEYPRILTVMANSHEASWLSANRNEGEPISNRQRMVLSAMRTVQAVNPVLSLPQVATAKPLSQLSFQEASYDDLYNSALLHEFKKDPSIRLSEADGRVVRLFLKNGVDVKDVENIVACSWNLRGKPERELMEFVENERSEQRITDDSIFANMSDEEVMATVDVKFKELTATEKAKDVLGFWNASMRTVFEAALNIKKTESILKLSDFWAERLELAAKEFQVEIPKETKEVCSMSKEISSLSKNWDTDDIRDTYFNILEKINRITGDVFDKAEMKVLDNPLLRIPEIAESPTLSELIKERQAKASASGGKRVTTAQALYCSALKEAVLTHPNVGVYEADKHVYEMLQEKGIKPAAIEKAMLASPRLDHLPPIKKKADFALWSKAVDKELYEPKQIQGR